MAKAGVFCMTADCPFGLKGRLTKSYEKTILARFFTRPNLKKFSKRRNFRHLAPKSFSNTCLHQILFSSAQKVTSAALKKIFKLLKAGGVFCSFVVE